MDSLDTPNRAIHFTYNQSDYYLKVYVNDLGDYLAVEYNTKCGSDDKKCKHKDNKCMVLENIRKGTFDLSWYVENNITESEGVDEDTPGAIALVKDFLQSFPFADYINCTAEEDYYGERLHKTVPHIDKLVEEMMTALSASSLKNIKMIERF